MDAVQEIKRRLDLVEYIGRATPLQRAGRNFRGLCPFHTEKTASFYVFPDRASWRCFGQCSEGGDLFSFVQKRNGVEFRDALVELAREAGVELTAENKEKRSRVEKLAAIVSAAVDYYERCLRGPEGEPARHYLRDKRHLGDETIAAFRLGWAPGEWRRLRDHLAGRGYDEQEAVAAGLLVEPESGGQPYDRFRGRVVIPIVDERGVYSGFGGRGLQGEEPKYLNSPQTELFDKGRTLFGLFTAAKECRESGVAVVVEGYMDVIGPWQAGFRNVVATMGTSLTEHQAGLLKRYARRVVLAMDPDAAGLQAAERAGELFVNLQSGEAMARSISSAEALAGEGGIDLRVAPLPPGKDPDEITASDPAAWRTAIDSATPFPEFFIRRVLGEHTPESPLDRRRVVERLRPIVGAVRDPIERGRYVQQVARLLDLHEAYVHERLTPRMRPSGSGRGRGRFDRGDVLTREETLLAVIVQNPPLVARVTSLPPDLFTDSLDRAAFRVVVAGAGAGDGIDEVVRQHLDRLRSARQPALTADGARKRASDLIQAILRDRLVLAQAAVSEAVSYAERTMGSRPVDEESYDAWAGRIPADAVTPVAEKVIEQLELGRSIHRAESAPLL